MPSSSTIANDVDINNDDVNISRPTIVEYIDVLKRLHVIKEIYVFTPLSDTKMYLRTTPKIIFNETSIALASLNINQIKLSENLSFLGCVFENFVLKDLQVYCQYNNYELKFYRDAEGNEIDAIIEDQNGD
jgi:predicted AAA+ superfamily ATPase